MNIDYKYLQKPLIIFVICLAISTILVSFFYIENRNAIEHKQATMIQLDKTRALYTKDLQLKAIYLKHEHQFSNLKNQGFFSEENRLNWIYSLEKVSHQIKIPFISYTIDETKLASNQAFNRSFPGIDLYSSSMQLDLQLLHEGDLYNLFNMLKQNTKGLFDIEMCAITRNSLQNTQFEYHENGKSFSALCKVSWYTAITAKPKQPVLSRRRP